MSKDNKKILDDILQEVKILKKEIKALKDDNIKLSIITEEMSHMHQKIADISCKIDLVSSSATVSSGVKSPQVKKKAVIEKKAKLNIMTYFKIKFKEDREALNHIISPKEEEKIYEMHAAELKNKKKSSLETTKVSILYKELIKPSASKTKLLRALKEKEEEDENEKAQEEILENDIEDDDDAEVYDEVYEIESEDE